MLYDKILFLHSNHDGIIGGLPIIDRRNRDLLASYSSSIIDIVFTTNFKKEICIRRYFNYLRGFWIYKDPKLLDRIDNEIIDTKKTLLFVSHSTHGILLKKIRRKYPDLNICCFFHNVEAIMAFNCLKNHLRLNHLFKIIYVFYNERLSCLHASTLITLNERDASIISNIYRVKNIDMLPTSLFDRNRDVNKSLNISNRLKCLFVGTYFWGNIKGVKEFIEVVTETVSADFYIVGNGMEQLEKVCIKCPPNVFFIGQVDSAELDCYYRKADIFIAPILSGGGMKTKIAEAMMFSLPILGTQEAFEGYNFDINLIGRKVKNTIEYIELIRKLDSNRQLLAEMSRNSRLLFEKRYSLDSSQMKMDLIINR